MKFEEANPKQLLEIVAREALRRNRGALYSALSHLSQVGRVGFSSKVSSACLRLEGGEFRIEFSREFLRRFVRTSADLLHLVVHEVSHRIEGDLRRPVDAGVPAALTNLAADLRVNAEIEATLLGKTPGYFERLYARDRFPENLLLPPGMLTGLKRGVSRELLEPICRERFRAARDPSQAARIYLAAWLDRPSFDALLSALEEFLLAPEQLSVIRWLGEHQHGEFDEEAVSRIRGWLNGHACAGPGGSLEIDTTEAPPVPQGSAPFYEAVRLALVEDPASLRTRVQISPDRGVLPHVGRRDAYLIAAGHWPGLFAYPAPRLDTDEQRVHVYVDGSYSTRGQWGMLYGLILHLKEEIGDVVWSFSNQVTAVGVDDLRSGRVPTTGGTDFDCVAEHALARGHRKILVLTDGVVSLDAEVARQFRERGISVFLVLTQSAQSSPLVSLATRTWVLSTHSESGLEEAWLDRSRTS
jgi:hypothetical protein